VGKLARKKVAWAGKEEKKLEIAEEANGRETHLRKVQALIRARSHPPVRSHSWNSGSINKVDGKGGLTCKGQGGEVTTRITAYPLAYEGEKDGPLHS